MIATKLGQEPGLFIFAGGGSSQQPTTKEEKEPNNQSSKMRRATYQPMKYENNSPYYK